MPNRRHPSKRFIGIWGTIEVYVELQEIAKKKGIKVSVLIREILLDFTEKNMGGE
jgi:hypothetical protein